MHQVIRVIVYAHSEKEALFKGKEILETLCGNGKEFISYTTFDDKNATDSGMARWGKLPIVARADSDNGRKLIDEGFQFTKNEFLRSIKEIRKFIQEKTNEELFEENGSLFKERMYWIGRSKGANIWLYDSKGVGIRDTSHLNQALEKKDFDIWVVPADVTF